jgi:hypothetical protein
MRDGDGQGEGEGDTCHFENYLAAFFERYVVGPVCFANVTSRRSAFPSGMPSKDPRTGSGVRQIIIKILRHIIFKNDRSRKSRRRS